MATLAARLFPSLIHELKPVLVPRERIVPVPLPLPAPLHSHNTAKIQLTSREISPSKKLLQRYEEHRRLYGYAY